MTVFDKHKFLMRAMQAADVEEGNLCYLIHDSKVPMFEIYPAISTNIRIDIDKVESAFQKMLSCWPFVFAKDKGQTASVASGLVSGRVMIVRYFYKPLPSVDTVSPSAN